MNKKVKIAIISIVSCFAAAFILAVVLFFSCDRTFYNLKRDLKSTCNVDLPSGVQLIYNYDSGVSFFGDRSDYYVLQFKTQPTQLIEKFNCFAESDFYSAKDSVMEQFNTVISLAGEIPEKYLPDWEGEYYWNCGGEYHGFNAVYYPETLIMLICFLVL